MKKIHLSTDITAPKEHVWNVMLQDATYREWTAEFAEGSYYKGEWKQGADIQFLGPSPDGGESGIASRIAELRPYEFVSIEHLGMIKNGTVDTTPPEVAEWKGVHENYTFETIETDTRLTIDMDIPDSEYEHMEHAWKKTLEKLKVVAERT